MIAPPHEKAAPMPGGGGEVVCVRTSNMNHTTTAPGVQENPFIVSDRKRGFAAHHFAFVTAKNRAGILDAHIKAFNLIAHAARMLNDGCLNDRYPSPPFCEAPALALMEALDTALACCAEVLHRLTKLPED